MTPEEAGAAIAHWWEHEAEADEFLERNHAARIAAAIREAVAAALAEVLAPAGEDEEVSVDVDDYPLF